MKKTLLLATTALSAIMARADEVEVKTLTYAGPFVVQQPVMIDETDVNSKTFNDGSFLDASVNFESLKKGHSITTGTLPGCESGKALHLLGFTISNTSYSTVNIEVDGIKSYQVYLDDKQINGGYSQLQPSVHNVVIKYLSQPGQSDSATIKIDGEKLLVGELNSNTKRPYNIYDVLNAKSYSSVSISPNGKYLIYKTRETATGGAVTNHVYLKDLKSGNVIEKRHYINWMPRTNKCYFVSKNDGVKTYSITTIDPATQAENVICTNAPQVQFTISPTEDYLIYSVETEGPKEKKDVFEVIEPDDRQPGWRKRTNLYKYDLKSGLVQQLTYGHHNVWLNDISCDGKYILISKSESHLEARPTTVTSLYRLNLENLKVDTLIDKDGFIASAQFSPDGTQVMVSGSPEALDGIGKNINANQTPSMYDYQLFLSPTINAGADFSPRNWKALTRDFNPNVQSFIWSKYDGQVYLNTEDKDFKHLYKLNIKTGKFKYIDCGEELLESFSISDASNMMAYYGQGASNSDRLYTMNTKNSAYTLIDDIDKDRYKSITLGKCEAWDYINEKGDTICCRYYLPANFDASKTYPMIVNYYGGCSPTSRTFQSRYPQHAYASLGYVVLVVNPRGATGFGQKWSAAHVNTAGKGVAEDIIGAVQGFCKDHSFVNSKKIGCIGASYGGFMTQYLQTVTDIFAAAVSHAGISDHTSYWGEGYWGYSYSEVSMANSYPWTRKDLYVDQSPLYNADKVHTPLLFVHGTGDTNVPVGESIQMYTALKLLGRPTAMVLVDGENHWILDYNKRIQWQNSIWAWFAKYLQDDSTWWDSMYGKKAL
ncbi:MAG: prolyl oligopeptidase family serine peptidase [Bacteroidaceae bacterium]|nr:prolyl oligopeptidase family serine peptidase [Bacteroidaceae bacterium]